MKQISNLKMTYKEWRKYLKPFLTNGVLKDIRFTRNKFTDLPNGKYWAKINTKPERIVGFIAENCLIDDNVFMGEKSFYEGNLFIPKGVPFRKE